MISFLTVNNISRAKISYLSSFSFTNSLSVETFAWEVLLLIIINRE